MNRRSGPWLVRILFALTFAVALFAPSGARAAAEVHTAQATASPDEPTTTVPTTAPGDDIVIDEANPFLPEDRDLTQCVGTLERPGCGSEARGGWHQNAVAIAMVAGLLIVFGRIAWGVRRSQRTAGSIPE